jgi:hypothetical protein
MFLAAGAMGKGRRGRKPTVYLVVEELLSQFCSFKSKFYLPIRKEGHVPSLCDVMWRNSWAVFFTSASTQNL